jgi:predicted enzyme related to lactoylglutathione lyase
MPTRDAAPVGAPCWIDLFTSDADRARAFYGELFGWTAEDPNPAYGGYFNFQLNGVRIAGAMPNDGATGAPDGWNIYLAVENAEAATEAVSANGGQVFQPAVVLDELGSMAIVADAGGAQLGIWQPGTHKGFGYIAEPGAPGWFELYTTAYEATVRFYQDAFGWDTATASDEPGFRYTTLGENENALAGIMDATGHDDLLPEGVPAQWAIYFAVDNADKTLERVAELGGSVLRPAEDTPYGRLAHVADPTGAQFKILQA